ncbi:steroid C27-monooxygenase [Mycolicibacterium sphagni]|uniref:Steroid C26-monooxygenase n=1 Tax=Mycolicibacterium sphagni TaxID=1786 RepID=A0A255E1D3_9MYCO|nr:steroid C27-monooxygenase [Mycolicibacterium sphagni]
MPSGFDFTDPDLIKEGMPVAQFAQLRKTAPVWWNEQPLGSTVFDDGGYWVITKHRDIRDISRDGHLWSTNKQGVVMRFADDMTKDQVEITKALLINHDAPEHTRLRKLVARLFTPRAVAKLEEKLADAARDIVAAAAAKGTGDFVDDIAMQLPLLAIADLLGVPEADRQKLFHWTNSIMNTDDPDFNDVDPIVANAELMGYAYSMAEDRRKCPADDIVTRLVEADIDGEALSEVEFAFFVILLAVAGNETTRNAMTHGMNAFFENPDQWELFKRERPETAADEIVRWATPVHCFQRTALQDVELGGVTIREGQRAGLFYSSANYDEDVFDDPFRFDILRDPNPHLGFGGNGAHFCIGANLARMEIKLIFNEIANQLPDISKLGEPQRLRSGWLNGVKELPVAYH